MTKKEWNNLDEDVKEIVIKIAKANNCSLDEAYDRCKLIGGALAILSVLVN